MRFLPYWSFPLAGRRGTTVIDRSTAYPVFGLRAGRLAAELASQGGVHLVHGMGAASLGYARVRIRDWFGTVPLVFNPHGMEEFGSTGPGLGALKGAAYAPLRAAVRTCARAADRIIATDRAMVPTVIQHLGVPEAAVSVVPNACDLEELDRLTDRPAALAMRERLGLAADDVLLVGVGRLEENKGFHYLVGALKQLVGNARGRSAIGARWRCVLLGEGPYRGRLEQEIRLAGLEESIRLPGRIGDADLHAWYEAATLFVHPSLYEGSSIVTLEAMAHRRAVVGTMAGGLPDKIRPGVNGWLVPPADAPALAKAIEEALSSRHDLPAMGDRSREIVEQEFAWTTAADRLVTLYKDVLSGRGSDRREPRL